MNLETYERYRYCDDPEIHRQVYLSIRHFAPLHDHFDETHKTMYGVFWHMLAQKYYIPLYYAYPDTFGRFFDKVASRFSFASFNRRSMKFWLFVRINTEKHWYRMNDILNSLLRDITEDEFHENSADIVRCLYNNDQLIYPGPNTYVSRWIDPSMVVEPLHHHDITHSWIGRLIQECAVMAEQAYP